MMILCILNVEKNKKIYVNFNSKFTINSPLKTNNILVPSSGEKLEGYNKEMFVIEMVK